MAIKELGVVSGKIEKKRLFNEIEHLIKEDKVIMEGSKGSKILLK